MIRFGFKIKTRDGMVVENLMVVARDRAEAERKLAQVYRHCEILVCQEQQQAMKDGFNLESAINLIGRESDPEALKKKN